jgi:hypothetical protein
MDGSGCAYAVRAALWTFLMLLTLGLILPWRAAALERYKMRHCYYGDLQGSFEGRGLDFLKRGWWLWLLAALLVIGPRSLIDIMVVAEKPLSDSTAHRSHHLVSGSTGSAVYLRRVQSGGMALVGFGNPFRSRTVSAARRAGRPLLEGDRLVPADLGAVWGVSIRLCGLDREH